MKSSLKISAPLVLIHLLLTFSCQSKKEIVFDYPSINDIDEITTEVLFNNLPVVFKSVDLPDTVQDGVKIIRSSLSIPICIELRKIRIAVPDTFSDVPPPRPLFDEIRFEDLYNEEVDGKQIFNSRDSAFFFFQNDTLFNIQLPAKLRDTLKLTSFAEQKRMRKAQYYYISTPIFSADLKTAYIEVTHACSGLCGSASACILQKINGRWKIVKEFGLWIS